jgi:hypothetical protein
MLWERLNRFFPFPYPELNRVLMLPFEHPCFQFDAGPALPARSKGFVGRLMSVRI